MAVKQKLSELADSYIGFIDYGVRAWLFAFFGYMSLTLLGMTHLIDKTVGAYLIIGVFWIMSLIWTYDYAKGYVPVWWLRLGYGKNSKAKIKLKNKDY